MTVRAAIVMPLMPTAAETSREGPATAHPGAEVRRLTAALAAGDEEAFREFHAAYFDRLLRYLIVVTRGDEQAARDALQETFTRVARHARRFDGAEKFWSWLTVLARSAAADAGRKRRSHWRLLASYALSWMPSPEPETEIDEADQRLQSLMMEGLNGLRGGDRMLIEGKYLHGASVRELAAQSNLTEKAVESRLARAREQLRAGLLERLKNEETR